MPLRNLSEDNISTKVIDELRAAIQNGELEPGTRLVERKLAERLGVSHIPVREALAILTEERLIEREPRRGARVASLSRKDLAEITSLRIVLEQFVARRVQERWTAKTEKQLRKITASMTKAATLGDRDTMFELDRQFHETLWEMSEHQLLVELTARLRGRLNGFLRMANKLLEIEQMQGHSEAHIAIVEALAGDDEVLLDATIAEHIQAAADRIEAFTGPDVE
ncbi:GntR family transcriptional regulator [Diaminobutyricibacter sp. McL0608]|uniref:GntR family transcriptional regulator n=1 Tax=Leifsonia sp. McL0608 TaxID=3143537 RepID=UPI0031F2F356